MLRWILNRCCGKYNGGIDLIAGSVSKCGRKKMKKVHEERKDETE